MAREAVKRELQVAARAHVSRRKLLVIAALGVSAPDPGCA